MCPDIQAENDTPLTEAQVKREIQLKIGNLTGAALTNFREAGDPNAFAQAMRPLFAEAVEVGAAYQRRLIADANKELPRPSAPVTAPVPGAQAAPEKPAAVAPARTAGEAPPATRTIVAGFEEEVDPDADIAEKTAAQERAAKKAAQAATKKL